MSNPSSPSNAELSVEELELLARARLLRRQETVPELVRERLRARLIAEVQHGPQNLVVPARQLVPVRHSPFRSAVWLAGALALGLVLLANARALFTGPADSATAGSEPSAPAGSGRRDGLLHMPIFQAPAQTLAAGALPSSGPNLLGEQPFSAQSRAWQVRRWDDLSADPGAAAAYDFSEGALCVVLGAGERVLGGWPWLAPDTVAPPEVSPPAVSPPEVPLLAGKSYRVSFKAWAREPLPAQLLIAVGHVRLPFSAAGGARVPVSTEAQQFVVDFVAKANDPSVGIAFLATGASGSERTRVCLSDVLLTERSTP